MLSVNEKERIKRFMMDKELVSAVRKALEGRFTKPSGNNDVQTLAAERIALNLLQNAFQSLNNFATDNVVNEERDVNIGL